MKPKTFISVYSSRPKFDESGFNRKREYLSSIEAEFEGRIIKKSAYVVDDPRKRFEGMKASDFALENQLALNVPMQEVRCSLQTNEIDNEISRVNSIPVSHVETESKES